MGNHMENSLMFILYGDPNSQSPPTLSIRSTTGHMAPVELAMGDQHQGGIHVGYIDVRWEDSETDLSKTAAASFTCYGCNAWFNADISATTPVLPMIWAINAEQDMSISQYSDNAPLAMHDRFGSFDLDMTKEISTAPPRLPDTIVHNIALPYPGVKLSGYGYSAAVDEDESEGPRYISSQRKLWVLHGLLLTSSFYIFIPGGILFLRLDSAHAFNIHLVMQILGSMTALSGATLGFLLSRGIHVLHQYLGLGITITILLQVVLGWTHHVEYKLSNRKTWMGRCHVWFGWPVLILGWMNLVMGLHLSDYTLTLKACFTVAACAELASLVYVTYRQRCGSPVKLFNIPASNLFSKKKKVRWAGRTPTSVPVQGGESLYALAMQEDDENSSDSYGSREEDDLGVGQTTRKQSEY